MAFIRQEEDPIESVLSEKIALFVNIDYQIDCANDYLAETSRHCFLFLATPYFVLNLKRYTMMLLFNPYI